MCFEPTEITSSSTHAANRHYAFWYFSTFPRLLSPSVSLSQAAARVCFALLLAVYFSSNFCFAVSFQLIFSLCFWRYAFCVTIYFWWLSALIPPIRLHVYMFYIIYEGERYFHWVLDDARFMPDMTALFDYFRAAFRGQFRWRSIIERPAQHHQRDAS